MSRFDVAIIGAGMAGASLAAALAPHRSVLLLEAEDRPGYHSTGRSAAFWTESYGGTDVQPLTSASFAYLSKGGYLTPRGALHIAARDGSEQDAASRADAFLHTFQDAGVRMERVDRTAIERLVPGIRPGWDIGVWEPDCRDIDVASLHGDYLRAATNAGASLRCRARLEQARFASGTWSLETGAGSFQAERIVNAAGAWADAVAERCAVRPLDIRPYRRTIAQLRIDPAAPATLPLVLGLDGSFYCKPDAGGRLWLSPHDETPMAAGDVAPDEIDVARAIERLQQVVDWRVEAVEHRWAGLRSFAPDRLPVIGAASDQPHFFWFAGQGGFGIQTAPAAADLGAALLLDREPAFAAARIDASRYSPSRFG